MKSINTLAAREALYATLKKYYPKADIQPVEIRSEVTLLNDVSEYKFPLILGDAPALECEKRLLTQDLVVIADMGLGYYERDRVAKDAPIKLIETYANVNATTAGGATFNWKHLRRIWMGGNLSLRRTNKLVLEETPTSQFYESPVTQQASATTNNSFCDASGRKQIMPRIKLRGGEQTELKATFKPFAGVKWAQDAPNVDIQLVVLMAGFVVKGEDGKDEIEL